MKLYLVPNSDKPEAVLIAQQVVDFLYAKSVVCLLENIFAEAIVGENVQFTSEENAIAQCDVVITIGGDGTMLHTAAKLQQTDKPLLGINVGRLGFLATVEKNEIEQKLQKVINGDYHLDERMMLDAWLGHNFYASALNEIVVFKGTFCNTINCDIYCDDCLISSYRGDGVICATPTGSTGYSLSAGGPMLDAQVAAIIVTPICAHSLNTPPMIFSAGRELRIEITSGNESCVYISADGRFVKQLETIKTVTIKASDKCIKLVSIDASEQFNAIDKKLKGR